MQNLDGDLKEAFLKTLCGTWKERKETVDRVFVEDAKFWHIFHNAFGRKNIHGIYQLWASTNYPPLKIDFLRIVADERDNVVLVDLLEYCNVYPCPPWTFFGGPNMRLHVILGLVDTPAGKKIEYQEDHSMWMESLLFHTLPAPVGEFLHNYTMPFFGSIVAELGNRCYESEQMHIPKEVDFQRIDGEVGVLGLRDVRADLSRALCEMFSGHSSGVQRRALINRLYAEDALVWNALYIVRGRKAIFGAVNLWCYFNHINVKINRIVPCGNTVLVDAAQEVKPKWWPAMMRPYVVWNHIILTLADSPEGGKVIQRHENHPMGTEATLIYNLGVISWIINLVRRFMGIAFGTAGSCIYQLLDFMQKQAQSERQLSDVPREFEPPHAHKYDHVN
ncbi:g5035 [Coccomyxa elongata]